MSCKLYLGGFREDKGVVIAEDKAEAEAKLRVELRLHALPCEVVEVDLGEFVLVHKDELKPKTANPNSKKEK